MSQPSTGVVEWVMRLIPVIDLARGQAVHARAGDRARYRPVESVLTPGRAGDALALVQAYRDTVGARECYVADLDAIQGGELQQDQLRALARAAAPCGLMVDAGARNPAEAGAVLALGAAAAVVGLETLRRMEDLAAAVAAAPPGRIVFGLDLRLGRPLLSPDAPASPAPTDVILFLRVDETVRPLFQDRAAHVAQRLPSRTGRRLRLPGRLEPIPEQLVQPLPRYLLGQRDEIVERFLKLDNSYAARLFIREARDAIRAYKLLHPPRKPWIRRRTPSTDRRV